MAVPAMFKRTKGHKYHAKKKEIDGLLFDSKKEADFYCELKMRKMVGEIKGFELQVPFELQPSFKHNGKTVRNIKYIADFVITYPDGKQVVVDVKGFKTDIYRLKKKLLLYRYPEISFEEH